MYFEVKIKSDKIQDNGIVKRITDVYLVDALSFTEAEAKVIDTVQQFTSGELFVSAVKRSNIAEVFHAESSEKFYTVKCAFITINERTAREKRSFSHILVTADDTDDALRAFEDGMKGTMANYEVASVTESSIIGVI